MMWRTGRPPKPSTGTAEDTRLVRRATLTIAVLTAIAVAEQVSTW